MVYDQIHEQLFHSPKEKKLKKGVDNTQNRLLGQLYSIVQQAPYGIRSISQTNTGDDCLRDEYFFRSHPTPLQITPSTLPQNFKSQINSSSSKNKHSTTK